MSGCNKGQRNPRGLCAKCAAPITWLKTPEGKWMPVNDREGRADPKELYNKTFHSSHWATCPASQEFKAQQAAARSAALAADPDMLAATTQLMEARKELEAKWATAAAQVKPRPYQRAVIARIAQRSRQLGRYWGIQRGQLQALALATVGVSGFEDLHAVPVTWLEEQFLWALERMFDILDGLTAEEGPYMWEASLSNVLQATSAHFARRCEERARAAGLKEPGRVQQ